jgi:hypothetical protein
MTAGIASPEKEGQFAPDYSKNRNEPFTLFHN